MELTVRRGDFLNELTLMQGVVERKNTIPILSNILLKASDGHLNFTSTDLDLTLLSAAEAKVSRPGSVTVPARKLFDLIRNLPDADVALKLMQAVIQKGFLYIAQPPLFKVAEGKKETYLKDEKEMSKFLLGRIGDDRSLTSEMSGASASGAKLVSLLEKMEEYRGHIAKLANRGIPEGLVRALLDKGIASKSDFAEKKKIDDVAKAARMFDFEKVEVVADEEHSGWALELMRRVNGVPRAATIDADFVASYEMKRIRETAKSIAGFLDGPYAVTRNGDAERHQTLPAVVDAIYESAKKGLVINRYKGLGEMNPEQLWDTTMETATTR